MPIVSLKNVTVRYGNRLALDDVSFDLEKGEYVGLIGPNGAGKSTLLKLILGIAKADKGSVVVDKNIRFGYVSQNYFLKASFSLSVEEVLRMGLEKKSFFAKTSERDLFIEKLKVVGLDEPFLSQMFDTLSGGQKQRVIIARSLLMDPNVLLFDEPLSGIDFATKLQIYKLLAEINKNLGTTILFVSHEVESIVEQCNRILCLNKRLHEGCHPIDFIQGKADSCTVLKPGTSLHPIHHHHK